MKQALLFVAVGALALTACSGAEEQNAGLPSAPDVFAAKPDASACSFKDAKDYANGYFKLAADRKTAGDFLKAAEGLSGYDRNTQFFELFKLISAKRIVIPSVVNASSFAAKLVLEAGDCGELFISHGDEDNIEEVLTAAIRHDPGPPVVGGAFAYRDDSEGFGGFVATVDGGSALWTANWTEWIGGRSVAFGAKADGTSFGTETLVSTFAYRWGVISDLGNEPAGIGNDDMALVELCQPDVSYASTHRVGKISGEEKKILKRHEGQTENDIAGFCPASNPPAPGGIVSRVLRGVVGFFAPTPLQARRRAPPGMSGSIDDLSDFIGVNPGAVVNSFTVQPTSGPLSEPFPVTILSSTAAGNPFPHVPIRLSVANNQGSPAGAELVADPGCPGYSGPISLTQNTDQDGRVSFCVKVKKAGGYIIEANHEMPGFTAAPVFSNLFNRTP